MPVPVLLVQLGFGSQPDDPVQDWTDVTEYVQFAQGVECSRGRSDEQSAVEPGRMVLTLRNDDGRFTWGNASGAYYPNVVPGKRIRVSVSPDGGLSWVPRFDGYVLAWPVTWGAIADRAFVRVEAVDRLARFGKLRVLRDPLLEELGAAAPVEVGSILT